ncbi:uncharacterized protein PST29_0275 [Pseudomonas sp. St29]|nr:uncharacterized protein PST29_0275 [Pseudomonas sp. St29]
MIARAGPLQGPGAGLGVAPVAFGRLAGHGHQKILKDNGTMGAVVDVVSTKEGNL